MGMSEFYGEASGDDAIATLRRAVELGVTLFDTADMYGQGENERMVGEALGEDRELVTIATKFGLVRDAEGEFTGVDGAPGYARDACEASLRRLGVDVIDLYQLHRVDPDVPVEETVGAMQGLVEAGKVRQNRALGGERGADQAGVGGRPIASVQSEYSLLERSVEAEVLPECEARGIAVHGLRPADAGADRRRFTNVEELDESDTRRRGAYPRLAGSSLREEPGARPDGLGDRRRPRCHPRPGRDRVAVVPLARRHPDPRHPERRAPGGEPGRAASSS